MDVKPGYYFGHWEKDPDSTLIIIIEGVSPGYVFDVMERFKSGDTKLINDVKLHKKPIVFVKRLTEMDKEG
jgi:hypothetical protein